MHKNRSLSSMPATQAGQWGEESKTRVDAAARAKLGLHRSENLVRMQPKDRAYSKGVRKHGI